MPITPSPTMATSSGYNPNLPALSSPNPGMMPSLNAPQFQFQTPSSTMPVNFQSIMELLTRQPASATGMIPGLENILGLQTQSLLPMFQQQTAGMMANAQTGAMQRGLTGSSIEAANILGAQAAGQQNMNQFVAQQLGTLGQAYQGAYGQDVAAQNQMYQNIAQAIGQQMAAQQQMQMFQQQLGAAMRQAQLLADAQERSALYGAGGAAIGGLASGIAQTGGLSAFFA